MRLVVAACALLALATPALAQFAGPLPQARCAGWQGEAVCETLHEDAQIRVLRCAFPPGIGHEPHFHPPHFGYVLDGHSTMRTTAEAGAREIAVAPGQTFSNDVELRHNALNIGAETTHYLIVEKKYADQRAPGDVAPGLCPQQ